MTTDATAAKELYKVVRDLSDLMTIAASARESVTEAIKEAAEKHEIDKKQLRKIARVYFLQSFSKESAESEEFKNLYAKIVGLPSED